MTSAQLRNLLRNLGACSESFTWLGKRDLLTAWNECERADHLLWFVGRIEIDRRLIVRVAAKCAETALQYVPAGEDRPRLAIEAALAWCDDPNAANLERVQVARKNASAYVSTVYAVAVYAATAAVYAATAVEAAADAIVTVVYTATAYASTATAYAYAVRETARRQMAVIVRENIPFDVVLVAARKAAS